MLGTKISGGTRHGFEKAASACAGPCTHFCRWTCGVALHQADPGQSGFCGAPAPRDPTACRIHGSRLPGADHLRRYHHDRRGRWKKRSHGASCIYDDVPLLPSDAAGLEWARRFRCSYRAYPSGGDCAGFGSSATICRGAWSPVPDRDLPIGETAAIVPGRLGPSNRGARRRGHGSICARRPAQEGFATRFGLPGAPTRARVFSQLQRAESGFNPEIRRKQCHGKHGRPRDGWLARR